MTDIQTLVGAITILLFTLIVVGQEAARRRRLEALEAERKEAELRIARGVLRAEIIKRQADQNAVEAESEFQRLLNGDIKR